MTKDGSCHRKWTASLPQSGHLSVAHSCPLSSLPAIHWAHYTRKEGVVKVRGRQMLCLFAPCQAVRSLLLRG